MVSVTLNFPFDRICFVIGIVVSFLGRKAPISQYYQLFWQFDCHFYFLFNVQRVVVFVKFRKAVFKFRTEMIVFIRLAVFWPWMIPDNPSPRVPLIALPYHTTNSLLFLQLLPHKSFLCLDTVSTPRWLFHNYFSQIGFIWSCAGYAQLL